MIQRVQTIYLFFAALAIFIITYNVPVLFGNEDKFFVTDFIFAHISAIATMLLLIFSIFRFKNRPQQLIINQLSKLLLSATFFIVFLSRVENTPDKGLILFVIPYILILLANRFIKKDEKLVNSADRIR
ncbi:MAG: DUF4293 family protein [Flavobacteriales bacterium]